MARATRHGSLEIVRVGSGRPELWLIAGVHGDEVEGMVVVEDALRTLAPARGTLVGVPVAHPAALALGTREGPDGVDLNRTYPGRPDGGPTERIAFELWQLITAATPDAILTLHSWSRSGSATPYVEHAVGDARGRELACALGLPFVEAWDWPDGLLGKGTSALGIATAELELFGLGRHTAAGLASGLHAARAAMGWLGMDGGEPSAPVREVSRHWLTAPSAGRVVQLATLGDAIGAGEPVAELRDAAGAAVAMLTSPAAGWVGIHVTYGQVAVGDPVSVVFVEAAEAASR